MGPSQGNQQTDSMANFAWLLVILTIAIMALWYFEKKLIIESIFFIRNIELEGIKWFAIGLNWVTGWVDLPAISLKKITMYQNFVAHHKDSQVTFGNVSEISAYVGKWTRYVVALVLGVLAYILFIKHRSTRFNSTHSMNSLKKVGVENWPQITPVVSLNLVKQDLDEGPWAMAQLPMDFCRKHDLCATTTINEQRVWSINKGKAEQQFHLQMGSVWNGVEALPIHLKALLVVFVGRAMRQRDDANRILEQVAASASHGKLNFEGVEELVDKYKDSKLIAWLEKRHAYIGTLFASMLVAARADGVLATAEFLWLKPVDRRMWYMLNTVGRQTPVIEAAGLYAHWMAEKKIGRSLKTPMVIQAVQALELAMNNILYVAEENRWHTHNAA